MASAQASIAATALFFYALLAALHAGPGPAPVRFIRIDPRVSVSPVYFERAIVWVETDEQNRALELRVVGPDLDRASREQLDGEKAPRAFTFQWKTFMPCGAYEWTATTFDSVGRVRDRARASSRVCGDNSGP
jgi:hypothetical protein